MTEAERTKQPWASGPAEILEHGLSLLAEEDSDKNRRLAMISIDNAVELMIKTFLNLPKRVTGLQISRKKYAEFSESFPDLLDALEEYAEDKLDGVSLGDVEWYHRLRNELYHQGNGLTVERTKVEVYAELAKLLFQNLYGIELIPSEAKTKAPLELFIQEWAALEQALMGLSLRERGSPYPRATTSAVRELHSSGLLEDTDVACFQQLRDLRNRIVHGQAETSTVITPEVIYRLRKLAEKLPKTRG